MNTDTNSERDSVDVHHLVSPWVDVTSFSRGQKDRTPRTWEAQFGRFTVIVTRHRYFEPDDWVSRCHGLWEMKKLASKDLHEAASQAKAMLQVELETAISEILGANALSPHITTESDHE